MASYRVLVPQEIREEGTSYLREKGYEVRMGGGFTVEDLKRDVVDCDAILARTAPFPAEVLEAGAKLKVIARHGVGVDNIDVARATELGIYVTNAPESNSNTVAEYALGMIIALGRNFVRSDRAVRSGEWSLRNRMLGQDIDGRTLGVLGLGKVGRRVAVKAQAALSMQVIAYDPLLPPDRFPAGVHRVEHREEIFDQSDFVSVHTPSTPETRGSIGAEELGRMKQSAFLINAARGDLIDEAALIEALRSGTIAGAGLDVLAEEPPPADHPLFALENVILTPHNAALTKECMIRMALHAARGIHEVLTGREPTWPVNRPEQSR